MNGALIVTKTLVCPERCCVAVVDPAFPPPGEQFGDQWVRPMYEVITDAGSFTGALHDEDGMRVPASEYARPDRVFL